MTDVFRDSLDWTAEDVALTELLIASADRLAAHQDHRGTESAPASPASIERRITRSLSRTKAAVAKSFGANVASKETDRRDTEGLPHEASGSGEQSEQCLQDSLPPDDSDAVPLQQADEQLQLPDLEATGLVRDRTGFRPHGFSVTDFTGAQWCQQQFAYGLSARLPEV